MLPLNHIKIIALWLNFTMKLLVFVLIFNSVISQKDTELFHHYMGRIMSDDAWKEVLADIEDINKYCVEPNGIKFDLADYVFVDKDDYDYEKLLLHFGGSQSLLLQKNCMLLVVQFCQTANVRRFCESSSKFRQARRWHFIFVMRIRWI